MSSQIVLAIDPITTANPFLGSVAINQICLNATEWIAEQHAFQQTAMQFGYFCLVTGAIVGFIAGYFYAKRRYGDI